MFWCGNVAVTALKSNFRSWKRVQCLRLSGTLTHHNIFNWHFDSNVSKTVCRQCHATWDQLHARVSPTECDLCVWFFVQSDQRQKHVRTRTHLHIAQQHMMRLLTAWMDGGKQTIGLYSEWAYIGRFGAFSLCRTQCIAAYCCYVHGRSLSVQCTECGVRIVRRTHRERATYRITIVYTRLRLAVAHTRTCFRTSFIKAVIARTDADD